MEARIYGPFLRLDKMTIGCDVNGHSSYNVGSEPLTKEEKAEIRVKFAKARKLEVFREFFGTR